MSTIQFKRKEVVARKEYDDSCYDHLDFGLLTIGEDRKKVVNMTEASHLKMALEDIAALQASCDRNFKILPGEKHSYTSGIHEGDFYTCRYSLAISKILTKYDLWYED